MRFTIRTVVEYHWLQYIDRGFRRSPPEGWFDNPTTIDFTVELPYISPGALQYFVTTHYYHPEVLGRLHSCIVAAGYILPPPRLLSSIDSVTIGSYTQARKQVHRATITPCNLPA